MSEIIKLRKKLHAMAEPSGCEQKTSAFLAKELKKLGFKVSEHIAGYGVVGVLEGEERGSCLALRADMDALRHNIEGKELFIHSCGHDANCAIVLSVAKYFSEKGLKKGSLKIIFQPAEENLEGALGMARAGVVDEVDFLLGSHLRPKAEAKLGKACAALMHGSSIIFKAAIHGKTAHGARPHQGINTIDAACLVVNAINSIKEDPNFAFSCKTTQFFSNTSATNAIPDRVDLCIDARAQNNEIAYSLLKKIENIIINSPKAIGASGEVLSIGMVPAAEYDEELSKILASSIKEVLGDEGLIAPIITPGGDDFHFYKKHKPSLKVGFIGLGANLLPGLHIPNMSFDERALEYGVDILKKAIQKILSSTSFKNEKKGKKCI